MEQDDEVRQRIASMVEANRVMLFMKGSRHMPMCGFSGAVVQVLDSLVADYATFNVLSDPTIREGIKAFSQWPTIPQLYVDGDFVGGCDIVREMYQTGELQKLLGVEEPEVARPTVHVTAAARKAISEAASEGDEGGTLRVEISPDFEYALSFDDSRPGDLQVDADGLSLLFDRGSASRADGMTIDYSEANGGGFGIENPNEPAKVKQLAPKDLAQLQRSGASFELLDVRTQAEREVASIAGARLLDADADEHIASLPKDAMLVFHCHHGGRSQAAAERYLKQGFTNVHNLAGGIDAWSREVDPNVPRY